MRVTHIALSFIATTTGRPVELHVTSPVSVISILLHEAANVRAIFSVDFSEDRTRRRIGWKPRCCVSPIKALYDGVFAQEKSRQRASPQVRRSSVPQASNIYSYIHKIPLIHLNRNESASW